MDKKYIPFKTRRETGVAALDEIIYIEQDRRKATLVMMERQVTVYAPISQLKEYTDQRFLDCHRSYLFNMDRIVSMGDQVIYLEGGHQVPLGRESFRRGRRAYDAYLEKKFQKI